MMKYFVIETSPSGKYFPQISEKTLNHVFNNFCLKTSWTILYARLFGLDYPDFLRMVRDVYGATLEGKHSKYIWFYFSSKMDCEKFLRDINKRFEKWMKI